MPSDLACSWCLWKALDEGGGMDPSICGLGSMMFWTCDAKVFEYFE
jgi:hypothetical protein